MVLLGIKTERSSRRRAAIGEIIRLGGMVAFRQGDDVSFIKGVMGDKDVTDIIMPTSEFSEDDLRKTRSLFPEATVDLMQLPEVFDPERPLPASRVFH